MDADLVRASRARVDLAQRVAAETLDHFVITACLLAFVIILIGHGHLDAVVRMASDLALDVVAVPVDDASGDGRVFLEDLAMLKLVAQVAVGELVLGNEDDAARVAVEPVDDAWPVVAVQTAELAEVELQSVDERAAPVSLGRVDDHVGRLVDDGEVFILVENLERNILGHGQFVGRFRWPHADLVAVANLVTRLGRVAVDQHAAGVDDFAQDGPAQVGEHLDEILIEAEALDLALGGEVNGSARWGHGCALWGTLATCRQLRARCQRAPHSYLD